jgi:nucleotide-binding universal stress UspA family protein
MKPKTILLPIDFSPPSGVAAKRAAVLARHFHSNVTLLHVNGMATQIPTPDMESGLSGWEIPFAEYGARWGTDEPLHSLVRESCIPADVLIVDGDAPTALAEAVRANSAGLPVISRSTALGAVGRLSGGKYGIICHAPCPVVSI